MHGMLSFEIRVFPEPGISKRLFLPGSHEFQWVHLFFSSLQLNTILRLSI